MLYNDRTRKPALLKCWAIKIQHYIGIYELCACVYGPRLWHFAEGDEPELDSLTSWFPFVDVLNKVTPRLFGLELSRPTESSDSSLQDGNVAVDANTNSGLDSIFAFVLSFAK